MDKKRCEQCGKRVIGISIWVNLILSGMKLFVGIASGSKACIADGLHSAANIVTSFAIMVSQKVSKKESNSDYHYGFGKVEFLAAGAISLMVITGATVLIIVSIKHLLHEPNETPHFSAMLMGMISVCANEMMFRYMRCIGLRLKSQTITASAWASRADCFSSIAVILGVVGSKLGIHHLDPITAIVVVAIIINVSCKIMIDAVKALMDTSVNDAYRDEIEEVIRSIENVAGFSGLKTRHIGHKTWVELKILVDPHCTLEEGQMIAEKVRKTLFEKVSDLGRIWVHFGPMEGKSY